MEVNKLKYALCRSYRAKIRKQVLQKEEEKKAEALSCAKKIQKYEKELCIIFCTDTQRKCKSIRFPHPDPEFEGVNYFACTVCPIVFDCTDGYNCPERFDHGYGDERANSAKEWLIKNKNLCDASELFDIVL